MMFLFVLTSLLLLLSGCATLGTTLPDVEPSAIEAEKDVQRRAALKKYMTQFRRLQDLATPILTANADLCARQGVDIGAYTLSQKDLPKALRDKDKGLPLKSPVIVYVRDEASLPKGGVILNEAGKAIAASKLKPGQSMISVRSGGEAQDFAVRPKTVCGYPARLKFTPAVNAYANGREIIVTTGMMDFATDEELALIIGHELAHNTQGHIRKIVQNTILAFGRGTFARQFESEADYVGLYYSARAGYAIDAAPQFWRKLALISVKSLDVPKTHPITPERYVRLRAAIEEVKAKQYTGDPLLPNRP